MGFAKKFQFCSCLFIFLFFSLNISSCAYKFSLLSRQNMGKYKSIYVAEPINLAGSHLPIEVFETEVEKKLIQYFPDVILSLTQRADLYLRVKFHRLGGEVTSLELASSVDELQLNDYKDEEGNVRHLNEFEDMRTGKHGALKETLVIQAEVELWDLKSKKKVFSQFYSQSQEYSLSFPPEKRLLEMEQQREKKFQELSELVAQAMMMDFVEVL